MKRYAQVLYRGLLQAVLHNQCRLDCLYFIPFVRLCTVQICNFGRIPHLAQIAPGPLVQLYQFIFNRIVDTILDSYYIYPSVLRFSTDLGEGYAIHKQDIFTRKQFEADDDSPKEFLSES